MRIFSNANVFHQTYKKVSRNDATAQRFNSSKVNCQLETALCPMLSAPCSLLLAPCSLLLAQKSSLSPCFFNHASWRR